MMTLMMMWCWWSYLGEQSFDLWFASALSEEIDDKTNKKVQKLYCFQWTMMVKMTWRGCGVSTSWYCCYYFLLVWLFAPPPLSNDEFVDHSFASGSTTAVSISASHSRAGWPWFSEAAAVELSPAISSLSSTAYSICSAFHIFCHSITYFEDSQ